MVVVFGSINVDLAVAVSALPRPGETVKGDAYQLFPGGKGANQALAARRAGADTALVGAVGRDVFASCALSLLESAGVDLEGVRRTALPTGLAAVSVDPTGENQITVASGANSCAEPKDLETRLAPGDILLLQSELTPGAVAAAAAIAAEKQACAILNAAPAGPITAELASVVDILVVNELEAATVASALGFATQPEPFASAYAERWNAGVVVTLGAAGALAVFREELVRVPAPRVKVVDTTAAGDAFLGTLAALLTEQAAFFVAVKYAVAAGSLAVEAQGAQPSIPLRTAIDVRAALMG